MDNYARLSRLKGHITVSKDMSTNIKALGIRETKDTNIEGRIQIDMMQYVLREHKLRTYSLNAVAFMFLGE